MMKPARFHGGPWNAVTRNVDLRQSVIRVIPEPEPATIREEDDGPPELDTTTGLYRQNPANAARYDWEGWQ